MSTLPAYTELQVCSNFSFLRGASHPEELVCAASELGYRAISLTDLNTLGGIVQAYEASKKYNISFITGAHISPLQTDKEPKEALFRDSLPFSLLLFPTDRASYANLSKLLSAGKLASPKGQCFLSLEILSEFSDGLLAVAVVHNFTNKDLKRSLKNLKGLFLKDRLSLALTHTYGPENTYRLETLSSLSQTLRIPLVATNDVHFHSPERRKLQDALTCIRLGCPIKEAGFSLFQNSERFLKSPEEIARLFQKYPKALARTQEITEKALGFSLEELKYEYPEEICPRGKAPNDYLSEITWQSAKKYYPQGIPHKVKAQLEHELCLIKELNYAKYFLTVYDIVNFARSRQILCQGRGAAANSAVCYVLGITAVDPAHIRLLFERFISKERNEPPDIDIDFEHQRREEVIQYIYKKYGRDRAALVSEIITYRTRSAVRDLGRVFSLPLSSVEALIKLMLRSDGEEISDKHLLCVGLDPKEPAIQHVLSLTPELKGFPRHRSQHVGGFLISQRPLLEIVSIENAAMKDRTVIEWDKNDIEAMGMLKIDLLALGMLTCIRKALEMINALPGQDSRVALHNIPAEDASVYDMICRADTIGVFQIESRAQMSMLPRLKPRSFYDLVIEVAIVRPGPIQGNMVHPYLRRRSGKEKVHYPNEKIKEILHPTLGVPIFQEQVMELSVVAAGFRPGEADELRRAMAAWKRKGDAIHSFKKRIIKGMLNNGHSLEFAKRVFEQIRGFGEYGFPQSHAASFAHLVYVSSWIKRHYPAIFAASLLNSQPMGFYRPAQIIEDAKRHGVTVKPVDVNYSSWDCKLENNKKTLRLGMSLVKGLEETQAHLLARTVLKNSPYSSLLKLWRNSKVKVSSLKHLARADAFQSMSLSRQQALWQIRRLKDAPLPLFDGYEEREEPTKLPYLGKPFEVMKDYESLSLSLKAHPVSFLREELRQRGVYTAAELKFELPDRKRASIAGLVLVRQRPMTASGILFMTIEDETGMANIIVKPNTFKRYQDIICDSVLVLISGSVQKAEGVVHLLAERFVDLSSSLFSMESQSRDFR